MAKKISILIVDDEESVRDSLYNWFIEDGYNVECAENAKKHYQFLNPKISILFWLIFKCREWRD